MMSFRGSSGVLSAMLLAAFSSSGMQAQTPKQAGPSSKPDAYAWNDREPDPRFKADILLVVAHPDDETLATAYLARAIYEQHKKVAVVFGTHGDAGNNDIGPEQAMGMGEIREIEGREAVGSLGITNVWFLPGRDTLSQDVLYSLAHWGHGVCLDQLVRIVRLTRPEVILTFLPDFTTGENHADHQAAGVLATEAFDLAGDPSAFSEQISPATHPDQNVNLTEALRPWQPEKIYYFYNPTHDIFAGQGPQYSSKEVSPSQHVSYAMLAAEALAHHRTQGGDQVQQAIDSHTLMTSQSGFVKLVRDDVRLIFGKSLVPSGVTDDVFTGVVPEGIPFHRAPGAQTDESIKPSLKIGDPWNFYHVLWQAHGLDHLANVVPPEVTVKVGGALLIPLIVDNPLDTPIQVDFHVQSAEGWQVRPMPTATVQPHSQYYVRVEAAAPDSKVAGWQQFEVTAESGGQTIGTVPMRAELSNGWVAPE